jgi:hypothetical protein
MPTVTPAITPITIKNVIMVDLLSSEGSGRPRSRGGAMVYHQQKQNNVSYYQEKSFVKSAWLNTIKRLNI